MRPKRRRHLPVIEMGKTREEAIIFPDDDVEVEVQIIDEGPKYVILGSIHRGGMGEILLGKVDGPEGFSRRVVLKGLLSKLSEDDVSYQLFMREARLMACLDHPNIVRVFDLPYLGGKPYLAMEYLRGRNFHQVIQRAASFGGVPPRIALHVVSQALRGLHYAHSLKDADDEPLGVIHRDVSPGNLLTSFFGEVKVTDFGIAKISGAPQFTSPRSIRGKARYVAPEQVQGAQATILSDIYSAGVVLAEALIGEPLWERGSVPETLLAIVTEDREQTIDRILLNQPEIKGLRSALRGALALNPTNRFASALQFAEVLEAIGQMYGAPVSQVELGIFVRDLFEGSLDVPKDDGFGRSGFPIPRFAMDDTVTPSTIITLEEAWIKRDAADTTRIRPNAPASLPVILRSPNAPRVRAADPSERQGPMVRRRPPPCPAPSTSIRADPLPIAAAVFNDPAEPPQVYNFSEVVPAIKTDEEHSKELSPLPRLRPRWAPFKPFMDPANQRQLSPKATGLLLTGIFIGATLAIVGCLIALTIG